MGTEFIAQSRGWKALDLADALARQRELDRERIIPCVRGFKSISVCQGSAQHKPYLYRLSP